MNREKPSELILCQEYKIHKLLADVNKKDDLEASGVFAKDNQFFVIFDNTTRVAQISNWVSTGQTTASWAIPTARFGADPVKGFEDITFDPKVGRFLLLVEAGLGKDNVLRAYIDEYDQTFCFVDCYPVNFELESGNKGFEGLTYIHRDGKDFILGLCEGNQCRGKKVGETFGGGRIQILERQSQGWHHLGTLPIPMDVMFEDYSSIDIREDKVAIISQKSSKLWIGRLRESDWDFIENGVTYLFPRHKGKIVYGNLEGVCWISSNQIVVVSDKKKDGDPGKEEKDQSIHVFQIPKKFD